MVGFNIFKRCDSTETLVSQHAHAVSKYWTNLALDNGTNLNIEQDPMHKASFYKDSSN